MFEARVRGGAADTPVGKVAANGLAEGARATVAVRMAGFDVSETAGETEARILSRRYLGVVELIEFAVSGAEKPVRAQGPLRRIVSRCARYLAFAAEV